MQSRLLHRLGLVVPLALAALVCGVAWRAERGLVGEWGFPLDDAWIHATVARNVAHGQGWAFNAGETAQPSSGPLWTLLVALGYVPFGAGVWVPKVLGVLCFLGCVWMAGRLGRQLTDDDAAGALAALFTAACAPLVWHGLSGMETPLAALLVTASLDAFYRWRTGRRRVLWAVFAALAVAARAETLVLFPLLALEQWWTARRTVADAAHGARSPAPAIRRELALGLGIGALVLLPYFLLNLTHAGSLFPTTFAAKAGHTGLLHALKVFDVSEMLVSLSLYPYVWAVFAVAFFARVNVGLLALAPVGAWALGRGPRRAWAPGLLLVVLPLLRGIAAPHQTPPIHNGRYVGAVLPLFLVCAAAGLVALWRAGSRRADAAPGSPGVTTAWLDSLATKRVRIASAAVIALALGALVRLEVLMPPGGGGLGAALLSLVPGATPEPGLHPLIQTERVGLVLTLLPAVVVLVAGALRRRGARGLAIALGVLVVGLGGVALARLPRQYARNVRNIAQMDVALGRWVDANVPPGERVAACDIGAIAFFGNRPVVDVLGLATPSLVSTQSPSHLRTLAAMSGLRPSYVIVFPSAFPEWTMRASLLVPVTAMRVDDNTILASHLAGIYKTTWDRFDQWYDAALVRQIDPPDEGGGWRGHWRRGLYNLGLRTRAELWTTVGDTKKARGDSRGCEAAYKRAIELDERHALHAWVGLALNYNAQPTPAAAQQLTALLDRFILVYPSSSVSYELAGDFSMREGRTGKAYTQWAAGLKLFPDSVTLLQRLERLVNNFESTEAAAPYRARLTELGAKPTAPSP